MKDVYGLEVLQQKVCFPGVLCKRRLRDSHVANAVKSRI